MLVEKNNMLNKKFIILFFYCCLVDNAFSDDYLYVERENPLWPVIKSMQSNEHKKKIALMDSSAYMFSDTGPLENAVLFGYKDLVESFAKKDCLIKSEGAVSLYLAASLGRLDIVKILINHGIYVDIPHESGLTSLYAAAEFGEVDVFQFLIESGANINHRANVNFTLLQLALVENRKDIVDYLLKSAYKISEEDEVSLEKLYEKSFGVSWPLSEEK